MSATSVLPSAMDASCCPALPSLAPLKTTALPLRALTPTPIQPEWHHSGTSTLARLRRIEHIDVATSTATTSSATTQEYTINIFHDQPQSHIPTLMWNRCPRSMAKEHASATNLRAPDLQVVLNASQFCSLRNIAHSCVTTDDHTSSCASCQRLGIFMTRGDGRPMTFVRVAMSASDDATEMLTGFLNNLLESCHSQPEAEQAHGCRGQRRIALALQEFLFRS